MKKYSVVIVEDHTLLSQAIASVVDGFPMFKVSYLCKNGSELVDKFRFEKNIPDLVLMDINMPIMNGDEVIRKIRKSGHPNAEIPIIAYSGDGGKEKIHKFLRNGMNDFFVKGSEITHLENLVKFWTA